MTSPGSRSSGRAADDRRLLQGDYHYPAHQEVLLGTDASADGGLPTGADARGAPATAQQASELIFLPSGPGAFQPGAYFTDHVTPLAGIRAALGPSAVVEHEKGCDLEDSGAATFERAVAAASRSEVAIVVVGGRSGLHRGATVGEARDATDLRLTGPQEDLVAAVAGTGAPTVVVVMSGRAHVLTGIVDKAAAVLVAWPLGEQGGHALADVLFGKAEPTGRLPISLPRATGQVPRYHSHRSGGARSMFYGDYTDCAAAPLFPFGYGLGYTTFEHRDLVVAASGTRSPITASLVVANTGRRPGDEVVQLYVTDLVASVARPESPVARLRPCRPGPWERPAGHVPCEPEPARLLRRGDGLRGRAWRVQLRRRSVRS